MTRIASRYAKALFSLSTDSADQMELLKNLETVRKWIYGSVELRKLVQNPLVPIDLLKDAFVALFEKSKAPKQIQNAVLHIIENGRMPHFEEIIIAYKSLYQENAGIKEATVTTALPLDKEDKAYFQDYLESRFNHKLVMTFATDPSLIGGFRVLVGSQLIDSSIKSKLFNLRQTLKGAS